jgi:peroxisome-assembly ATPase
MYELQIDTIQLLQRLYDGLIEKEDECQLDRYSSSKKAGRLGLTS